MNEDVKLTETVTHQQVLFTLEFIRILLSTRPVTTTEIADRDRDEKLAFQLAKQIIGPDEINRISKIEAPNDPYHYTQLEALYQAVIDWLHAHPPAGNMPTDLAQLVQDLSDSEKSKPSKPKKPLSPHDRVVLAVRALSLLHKQDSPDFSSIVSAEKNFIAKYLENQNSTQYLDQYLFDQSITSAVPLAQALEPIVPTLISTSDPQGNEYLRVTNLAKTLSSLELPAPLTNVLTALKLIHPTVQADQLVTTINSTPFTAKYGTVDSADSKLAGQLTAEHDLTATGQALTDQTIFADLRAAAVKGALSERQIRHLKFSLSTLSSTIYGLASNSSSDTAAATTILGQTAIDFVMTRLGIPTITTFKQPSLFSWNRIHQALFGQHGPIQARLASDLQTASTQSPAVHDFLTNLITSQSLPQTLASVLQPSQTIIKTALSSPSTPTQISTSQSVQPVVQSGLSKLKQSAEHLLSRLSTQNAPTTAGVAVGGLGAGLVFTLGSGLVAAGATGLLVFYGTRYYLTHGLTHTASVAAQTATTASHAIGGIVTAVGAGCASALVVVFMAVLSLPILLALLLFIINNSSLVVPVDNQSNIASFGPITLGPGGKYPYCWPNTTSGVTVSGYWPNRTQDNNHKGIHAESIDLGTPMQTSIYSTHNGTVEFAGWNDQGYGNLVIIYSQDTGITSYYAHLSQVTTSKGNLIPAGTQVGFSGSTGNSDGPHLHYELQPESQIDIKFVAPFGDNCERYRPGNVVSIAGCEASISGGADKLSTSCHN
jgi:murein DD-endopeptidase MepM/ murein hydrolase activator NlpD